MKNLLRKWFGQKEQPTSRANRKPSRPRLQVEALERRDVPALFSLGTLQLTYAPRATSELQADGTLQISGTNYNDYVRLDPSYRTFYDATAYRWRSEFTITVSVTSGETRVYDGYRVAKVVFDGKDGDDVFTIGHEAVPWPWSSDPGPNLRAEPFFPVPVHAAGGMGNDWLEGGSGNDVLRGDPCDTNAYDPYSYSNVGVDFLWGNGGNDNLFGMGSNDRLYGGTGSDYVDGGAGYDLAYGGDGNDVIKGGGEPDRLYGDNGDPYEAGGIDFIWGGEGSDTIYGGGNNDLIWGEGGADFIFGEGGSDYLLGGEHDDWIYGGVGNDLLEGNNGFDRLWGGEHNDVLDPGSDGVAGEWAFGESGTDRFVNIEREWRYYEKWRVVRHDWTDYSYWDEYLVWDLDHWTIVRDTISYVDFTADAWWW